MLTVAKFSYPLVGLGVLVMVDSDPALEGTDITFGCLPELVLVGPNTSTCMENGEWRMGSSPEKCDVHR